MGGIFRNKEAMFVLFLRGRRADFKAHAILVLRLRTANLLEGATLTQRKVISPIQEPTDWVSSLIAAKKPDGNIRFCIDPQ